MASGKVKAMGLDLRRRDTPVFMQQFLSELLLMVLTDKPQQEVLERNLTVPKELLVKDRGWEKGSVKRANKIGHYLSLNKNKVKQTCLDT